jgi:thiopeptide-type bacteriocin biosynthesis protein
VSCPPLHTRTRNVARSPQVLPHLIRIGEYCDPDENLLPINDLAVSGDTESLFLMSLSQQRPVEATVFNAVELANYAHPLQRFLCEIGNAYAAPCVPFSWGAASQLPFLPRLRHGRTILSPARWRVAGTELPGRDVPWPHWVRGLTAWRRRADVPAMVFLGDGDRRLRLDLDEPSHLQLMRTEVDKTGHVTLREAPDTHTLEWFDGRAHEIVVPLIATNQFPTQPMPRTPVTIRADAGHLPGAGEWLFATLYGPAARHTAILDHLPALMSTWDPPVEWWFLPYQDPQPHLRLRIRLSRASDWNQAVQRVGTWAAHLRRLGLLGRLQFETYYPQTGRFGNGPTMAAAEAVFAADSATAIAQRTRQSISDVPHPHAVLTASLGNMVISFLGDVESGMCWLTNHVAKDPVPASDRLIRDQALRLADPSEDWAAMRTFIDGKDIATTWTRRSVALRSYHDAILMTGEINPDSALAALLHLHSVRTIGINPIHERACLNLARAAALSWIARARGVA